MNFYFEVYTKDPQTGHGGFDIITGYVKNCDTAKQGMAFVKKHYNYFDEFIDFHESSIPVNLDEHTPVLDVRAGTYPLLIQHNGKYGDTILVANSYEEEQKCWLAIFDTIDVWCGYYLDLEAGEKALYDKALARDWQAAKTLLLVRSGQGCEYETIHTEQLQNVDELLQRLAEDRSTKK